MLFKNKWLKSILKCLDGLKEQKCLKNLHLNQLIKLFGAGPSLEGVKSVRNVSQVVQDILDTYPRT